MSVITQMSLIAGAILLLGSLTFLYLNRIHKNKEPNRVFSIAASFSGLLLLGLVILAAETSLLPTQSFLPALYLTICLTGVIALTGNWQSRMYRVTLFFMVAIGIFFYLNLIDSFQTHNLIGGAGVVLLGLLLAIYQTRLSSPSTRFETKNVELPDDQPADGDKSDGEDLEKIQSELIHNEKLKALGMMSAGLAHEINNPLNYSILGLELLKDESRTMMAPEFESIVSDVEDGLIRIKNIVKDLKVFAHKDMASGSITENFLVVDAVASAIRITAKSTENIEISTTLAAPYRVIGELSSIIQVLVNLIANSAESIRQKSAGTAGRIDILGKTVDDRYVVEVVDDGMGLSQDDINNLITPFFTTKSTGRGTGLGLSISNMIVERHGGKIVAESVLGKWASLSFDLLLDTASEEEVQGSSD